MASTHGRPTRTGRPTCSSGTVAFPACQTYVSSGQEGVGPAGRLFFSGACRCAATSNGRCEGCSAAVAVLRVLCLLEETGLVEHSRDSADPSWSYPSPCASVCGSPCGACRFHPSCFSLLPPFSPSPAPVTHPQTPWAGGIYKLVMEFSEDYPSRPPRCRFDPPLFHPNVYPSGTVCLSILDAEKGWRPSITVKQILLGVQSLLDTPNASDPANGDAYALFTRSKAAYTEKIRQIAAKSAQEAAAE